MPGVADVQIYGERKYAMRIWLDPDKLAAYRLTVQDVEDAMRKQNLEVPAGRIESQQREFSVTARTDLNTPAAVRRDRASRPSTATPVRLRDVARVEEARGRRAQQRAPERRAVDLGRRDPPGHGQPAGVVAGRARR